MNDCRRTYLRATRNGISPDITIQSLDLRTLSAARIAQPAENLGGLASAELEGRGGLRLAAGDGAAELEHGLRVVHLLALEDQALEPRIRSLDLPRHVREFHANDGVVDELLAEGAALVGVLDALLVADAREAHGLDDDADALVVEVGHDHFEALVLLADQVLHWHFDVFERDVRGAAGPHALAVHAARAHAAEAALDQQDGDAVHAFAAGADGGCEVV